MGILRSKFNIAKGDKAAAESTEPAEAHAEETSRKPPATSPQKAAKGNRRRKQRGGKNQMTLSDLAAPTTEILSEAAHDTDAEAPLASATEAHLSALAQVRDLIAGPQLSDYAARIAQLEATAREQAAFTVQLRDAIFALESVTTALAERDDAEAGKRDALGEELHASLSKLGEGLTSSEERLRSETAAQGTVLTGLVQQHSIELNGKLQAGLERLETDKTSRAALAAVLVAAARSLDEFGDEL
jgi:hypothetical protein